MLKAYIILAHKNLDQVLRLIKRLDDDSACFYIHIDQKVPQREILQLHEFTGRLHIIERIKTEWAEFNLVQATLNGMKAVKESGKDFEMISLLSGQDYPVKSNEFIEAFYRTSGKRVFMEHYPIPNFARWKDGGGMYRVNKYFFGLRQHQRYTAKALNFLVLFLPFLKRKLPGNLVPHAGSQWWTINMYALNYILDFVDRNPAYSDYHQYTFAPDEIFFQTILLNATDEQLLSSIENNNKRYLHWKDADASHPEILNSNDLPAILASDAFFARKFDLHRDAAIFDLVNEACLKQAAETVAVSAVDMQ